MKKCLSFQKILLLLFLTIGVSFLSAKRSYAAAKDCSIQGGTCNFTQTSCGNSKLIEGNFEECKWNDPDTGEKEEYWECCKGNPTPTPDPISNRCSAYGGRCENFEEPCKAETIPGNFEQCAYRNEEGNISGYWSCCKLIGTPAPKPTIDPTLYFNVSPKQTGCGCDKNSDCVSQRCDWHSTLGLWRCLDKLPDGSPGCNEPSDCLSSLCSGGVCLSLSQSCKQKGGYCLSEGNSCNQDTEIFGNFDDCRMYSTYFKCCRDTSVAREICSEGDVLCVACFASRKTWTALGCIPTNDLNEFVGWVVGKIVFVASGIAFLLMAFGAFQIITSSGDPKKTQAGKEVITSALSGLLFIILSIFLLKLIGIDILHIPGFGTDTPISRF